MSDPGKSEIAKLGATLDSYEVRWMRKQVFLASRGYMLRPRYHPDWIPSWEATGKEPSYCEDFWPMPCRPSQTDARRISDNRLVYVKCVPTESQELAIATTLSSLKDDNPRNHCVPILDSFQDDEDSDLSYIVMPFLRDFDDPSFDLVNDIVDFTDQVLEGLVFMHENHVAHRDCAVRNILMDADSLYPHGFHPVHQDFAPDHKFFVWPYTRFGAPLPVKYYFVDFGLSSRIPPGNPRLVTGIDCMDREVPELSDTVPYDPFKTDIFVLGNLLRRNLYQGYYRLNFLGPLVDTMTKNDPKDRPDASAALQQWRDIRQRIPRTQCMLRARHRSEFFVQSIALDIFSALRLLYLMTKRFAAWSPGWLSLVFRR